LNKRPEDMKAFEAPTALPVDFRRIEAHANYCFQNLTRQREGPRFGATPAATGGCLDKKVLCGKRFFPKRGKFLANG
jgi:hypothetical protein